MRLPKTASLSLLALALILPACQNQAAPAAVAETAAATATTAATDTAAAGLATERTAAAGTATRETAATNAAAVGGAADTATAGTAAGETAAANAATVGAAATDPDAGGTAATDTTTASAAIAATQVPPQAPDTTPSAAIKALSRKSWNELDGKAIYEPWARVLDTYVDAEGLVDYAGLAGPGKSTLEAFMQTLASTDPSDWSEDEQVAFWINAYNAVNVYQVIERYPLDSVRDVGSLFGLVGGFFAQPYPVAHEDRTLDNIEHDILRADFEDARIHWALVCSSFGCPRLLRRPYVGSDLDPLLTELSFEFLASPRAIQIDEAATTLHVSSYFDWYGGDFEAESDTVVDYILRYAPNPKADWIRAHRDTLRLRFIDYDWTLNDQDKGPRSARPIM